MKKYLLTLLCLGLSAISVQATTILVEAENFTNPGGWVIDQQSIDTMGSSYLLAHGLGVPVADATTAFAVPEAGTYRVFVRTKDWVARWKAAGTPGRFQVRVNDVPLEKIFGTAEADWHWQDGGTVEFSGKEATLAIHDLTGFEGRCDAIVFSNEPGFLPPNAPPTLAALRQEMANRTGYSSEHGPYDLVVVGGGVSGCCAAISAARLGLNVALIQNRPVLGGNNSSEVRVWIQGLIHQEPYPILGEIVEELHTEVKVCPDHQEAYGDDVKLKVVRSEKNISLFLNQHVVETEMDNHRIQAVLAQDIRTGQRSRFHGRWFVDSTGDGTVGFLSGADHEVTTKSHLGSTNLWLVEDTGKPAPFPRCPWALDLTDKPFPMELHQLGKWFWESGFDLDTVTDAESIRDHNLRAMYGAWDCLKNVKNLYPNHQIQWAAYISGKRESRRLLGDLVLTKEDVLGGRVYPDGCVASTWPIDLHLPDPPFQNASPVNPFISKAHYNKFEKPYPIPYRCLYSRNVPNLMMAGRDISVTHEALGTVRVMATGGMMGEALGRAAYLCKKYNANPRDVYEEYLDQFLQMLRQPTKTDADKTDPG